MFLNKDDRTSSMKPAVLRKMALLKGMAHDALINIADNTERITYSRVTSPRITVLTCVLVNVYHLFSRILNSYLTKGLL